MKGNEMSKCSFCCKTITDYDEAELFGLDGDFIHKKCKPEIEKEMDGVVKISNKQFYDWMMHKE